MAKKTCLDGKKWDPLTTDCVTVKKETNPEHKLRTEPPPNVLSSVRVTASTEQTNPMMPLSPTVCAIVVLVTMGSILALAVWLIIYKRQTRLGSTSVEPEPVHEPLQKTEPPAPFLPAPSQRNGQAEMCQFAAEAPSTCPHLGAQIGSKREGDYTACRGPTTQTEAGGGLPACHTISEHRIPLPATELGGTALVTTKTV
ncbi:tumor necrosis factor receptor superfamily member 13C-like [Channa argus]|uniref:tumor necrosis factor receptor superfamily member 13C-like n=1 Tax=Channa argus TaxID=215402 RepID=UPI00294669E9|nr:hypothetical protein Q8A73_016608 [Channa argus]